MLKQSKLIYTKSTIVLLIGSALVAITYIAVNVIYYWKLLNPQ